MLYERPLRLYEIDCTNCWFSIRSWAHVRLTFKRGSTVRKPVNANPGLKVNRSTIFPVYKGLTALVFCILRLSKLKTKGQTIHRKPQRKDKTRMKILGYPRLAYRALNNSA